MEIKILEFIFEYACREGMLPTLGEIADGVGLKSSSSLFYYMEKLEDKGEIEKIGKRYRVRGLKYVRSMG